MEPSSRWGRRLLIVFGSIIVVVFASSWLARSSRATTTFDRAGTVLIVNDAGPVRVRTLGALDAGVDGLGIGVDDVAAATAEAGGVVVRSSDSWLLRRPVVESLLEDGDLVVRVTCPSRLPCRSSLEVFVPDGIELTVVAASDMVEVDGFAGALLAVAGDEGVALGSVSGSVSVVSDGPVRGTTLGPSELTVDVVDDVVSLTYLDAPTVVAVNGGGAEISIELPGGVDYAVDIEALTQEIGVDVGDEAERRVSVRSTGSVVVANTAEE